jgi:hypothetical protein
VVEKAATDPYSLQAAREPFTLNLPIQFTKTGYRPGHLKINCRVPPSFHSNIQSTSFINILTRCEITKNNSFLGRKIQVKCALFQRAGIHDMPNLNQTRIMLLEYLPVSINDLLAPVCFLLIFVCSLAIHEVVRYTSGSVAVTSKSMSSPGVDISLAAFRK